LKIRLREAKVNLMSKAFIDRYGAKWPSDSSELLIEMACIKRGGRWKQGTAECGAGLPHHYERMRQLLWPWLDSHRWHCLCRDEILRNKVTVLMGPGSCGKTHEAACMYLMEYLCFPEETCVLVSSTDIRGLELRVWGELKMLHEKARERYDWLPGHLIDSKHAIATDDIEEDFARDLRKGIIGIPCIQNGRFIGLGKYSGIKQKRIRLVADEAQFMGGTFLSAFANLDKNEDFRAIVIGNPSDINDPLGKAAEPKDGWSSHMEPDKTEVWETRFMNGRCVNLIGTDSPNFDYPADQPTRFKYLISREKIANTASFFSKDSLEYYSQCIGAMKIGILNRRVISREMCRQFHAFEDVIWDGSGTVRIAALDAAYGGDRCVLGHADFGKDIGGKVILSLYPPVIVPIRVNPEKIPEDQIADYVKDYCIRRSIAPENFFHDSTGRGSLGTALARVWSALCNPVEFGGSPTKRPVSLDLYIFDKETNQRRLKRCDEHFSKFVTELWFSVRYTIEAGQMRNLPEDVVDDGVMREWDKVKGDKIEIESKTDMKERTGRSPDLFDWLAIIVEGARRRGFHVSKLALEESTAPSREWLRKLAEEAHRVNTSGQLARMKS
jgi:hypothetical protein